MMYNIVRGNVDSPAKNVDIVIVGLAKRSMSVGGFKV